jgi:ABC-type nitrate/sulfonate/bicarbonate transport system ATPase subunit
MNPDTNILELSGITKIFADDYGTRKKVLENISFKIPSGSSKITTILSSFGGGKSTLLKIIAGVEKPTSGEVSLEEKKYLQAAGKIVLIPENSASLPWLNVRENIELACRLETCIKKEDGYEIDDLIKLVGLSGYENHYPDNHSFGFRFRISLARALMLSPSVLLLDDCFKKMDAATREEIYSLLYYVMQKVETQVLLATTNVLEALRLSGRIFLMSKNPGRIYKEIRISQNFIDDYNNEKFEEYKRMIEEAYYKENQLGTMNFSI